MRIDYEEDLEEIFIELVLSELDYQDLTDYESIIRQLDCNNKKQITLILRRNDATSKRR